MQKLAKRTAQAHHQATRRAQQMLERQAVDDRRRIRQSVKAATDELRKNIKDARRARREDWELGPLAPKRDLGFNNYGVLKETTRLDWTQGGMQRVQPTVLEKRCAWAGGSKQLNLAPGDRVIVMDGPDKGKVDSIDSVDATNGTVKLKECHRALSEGVLGDAIRSNALPISVASVRLVYPLPHPETKQVRDVIINQLKAVAPNMQSENMTLDRWENGNKWDRVVPGINVVIPWPEVKAPVYQAADADTVREQVEERSFYYGLLSAPMPEQVIDELRNKYSKFRTRHEPWYVEKKEAQEAAKKERAEPALSMQTPLADYHERQRELRDNGKEPRLTEPMLMRLGKFMARQKVEALDHAGISEVKEKAKPAPRSRLFTRRRRIARAARGGAGRAKL
ncbi:KOW domain-containing protein [Hirsutella rhossiliensis]|uniref:KOW domain-containing protein n=1 Tax=Hirsutella rhossiliensis TaxID=111463 RepID=A0A9P8SMP8_9HYPO|nr:KOW domain-containing protein [Hirsutella rhossiliensis]KAH0968236.1 KOW domain-containing protein [Hirsutella rhossiliensis]